MDVTMRIFSVFHKHVDKVWTMPDYIKKTHYLEHASPKAQKRNTESSKTEHLKHENESMKPQILEIIHEQFYVKRCKLSSGEYCTLCILFIDLC